MKIFLVCSTSKSWMKTGYGASLLQADASRLLVSFVEFSKDPEQQLAVPSPEGPYQPKEGKELPKELGQAFGPLISNHMEELFDEGEQPRIPRARPVTRIVINEESE